MNRANAVPVLATLLALLPLGAGCGRREQDAAPAAAAGGAAAGGGGAVVVQAPAPVVLDISDNPGFATAVAVTPTSPSGQRLDRLLRPALTQVFGDVRLTKHEDQLPPQRDGEVVLDRLRYVPRKLMDGPAGTELHAALRAAHFVPTPRVGNKPVITRRYVRMSVSKSAEGGGFSLEIAFDLTTQVITVESFRLGSKLDRLM